MASKTAVLAVRIVTDATKGTKGMEDAATGVEKFQGRLKKMAVPAGIALIAVKKLSDGAIESASALEQSTGGVESVFKTHADEVKKYASEAAENVGLATSQYQDLATVIGAQLKNMGTPMEDVAGQTNDLVGLGADLAATFGGSVSDAVGAVGSLLRGERDPIERYGVSITAADVQARLASQGLDGLTGASLKQAQATATLELLSQKTAGAHGAFARESNTLAGQQERLRAQFTNVKATLGQALLPALTSTFSWFSGKLLPASQRLGADLSARLGPAMAVVGRFITGTLVPAGRSLYTWFQQKIAPGIRGYVTGAFNGLRAAFDSVRSAIQRNEPQLRSIGNALKTVAQFIASKVAPVVGTILGAAFRTLGVIIGGVIDTIGALVTGIQNAYRWIGNLVDRIRNSAVGSLVGKLASVFTTPYQAAGQGVVHTAPVGYGLGAGGLSGGARFAWSPSAGLQALGSAAVAGAGSVYVDQRTYLRVDGALDPVGVADQLRRILGKAERWDGR